MSLHSVAGQRGKASGGGDMDFEVLGPLRVRQDGRPVQLSAPMPRMVLGVLLARANSPVPVDILTDALWAGQRDPRAAKKLQLHIHRLRRVLGDPARILFEHGGYTLRVHPGELDAEQFESILSEGTDARQPAHAATLLRRALGLWRGEPFGDITDLALLRAEADRLTERRLTGLARLYAAELACGQASTIIPELGELAAQHPMREQLQGLLMTALYQGGRQVEALEVYHRTRGALVEQLGLEPGNELQRLNHAILTGDPMLEAPSTPAITPAQLPADIADFTGRQTQLAALRHLAGAAEPPATVLIAITGKAGAGKTTLAVHAAHRLREQYPDGQLFVDLRGAQSDPLTPAEVLARFLRSLGVDRTAIPEDAEERAALYRSRLAGRRLLILLDDAACEAQLRPLLPGTPGCAVLVTSQTRLAGLNGAQLVDLELLDAEHAVELLARIAGPQRVAAESTAAREIVRLCGFLPLAIRIAGTRLAARPHWPLARLESDLAGEQHRLDHLQLGDLDVRASFARSYDHLDVLARRAFRLLGMLESRDFAPWVTAALLDIPQLQAEDLMDALVDMHLLEVAARDTCGNVRYRFHDLLGAYAREMLAAQEPEPERLTALERVFGGWLTLAEAAGRSMTGSAPGPSAGSVPADESGRCWRPDEPVVKSVSADPSTWFRTEWAALAGALDQAYSVGSTALGWALGVRLARIFLAGGYCDDWRHVCEVMLAGTQHALSAVERRGRLGRPVEEAVPHLQSALADLRELAQRRTEASALRQLGTARRLQRSHERAARRFQQMLDTFDEFSDTFPGPRRKVALVPPVPARSIRLAALHGIQRAGW